MKVQKTSSAADEGTESTGGLGDLAGNDTPTQIETQTPAGGEPADTASSGVPALPVIALEHPSAGGSYVRQADGTLVKQEG
jgi:hypothetical protein